MEMKVSATFAGVGGDWQEAGGTFPGAMDSLGLVLKTDKILPTYDLHTYVCDTSTLKYSFKSCSSWQSKKDEVIKSGSNSSIRQETRLQIILLRCI